MATYTTPRNWATGEVVTAANMDTYISDNLSHLHEQRVRSAAGTTNMMMQAGSYMISGANLQSGNVSANGITWPVAFGTGAVHLVAMCVNATTYLGQEPEKIFCGAYGVSTTGATIHCRNDLGHEATNVTISWIAIGTAP